MFSLGVAEIVVIATIALVFVGPENLPGIIRDLGRQYGKLRRAADELRRAFVLEADRQDADDRYERLKQRREEQRRKREQEEAEEQAKAAEDGPVRVKPERPPGPVPQEQPLVEPPPVAEPPLDPDPPADTPP